MTSLSHLDIDIQNNSELAEDSCAAGQISRFTCKLRHFPLSRRNYVIFFDSVWVEYLTIYGQLLNPPGLNLNRPL